MANTNDEIQDWMIRPCEIYKDEYTDCKSIKARFNQYFIFGKSIDCEQWNTDYENCKKFSATRDKMAAMDLAKSEENRRIERFRGHYGNTTWTKRTNPPEDWSKPLPEWMVKQNEKTYLALKSQELKQGLSENIMSNRTLCIIM